MNASEQIIIKQIQWATNKGLKLVGSNKDKGRKVYTTQISDNFFKPLSKEAIIELESGDGGELASKNGRPAKIQALHSSSALGVNMFDYWKDEPDLSLLCNACGLSKAGGKLLGEIHFEQKFSIDERFRFSPNLDVVIFLANQNKYKAFAMECKFTEAYSSRRHGGFDRKYFDDESIWQHLSATKSLAKTISPIDNVFKYLHAAQLIKHLLGLNREFGHGRYCLLYLWYDAFGEPGFSHRQEIDKFADIVKSDNVVFHHTTYQHLIGALAKNREGREIYIKYLTERYL